MLPDMLPGKTKVDYVLSLEQLKIVKETRYIHIPLLDTKTLVPETKEATIIKEGVPKSVPEAVPETKEAITVLEVVPEAVPEVVPEAVPETKEATIVLEKGVLEEGLSVSVANSTVSVPVKLSDSTLPFLGEQNPSACTPAPLGEGTVIKDLKYIQM